MNQQQLQTARAALWHQTAPLLTGDEALAWLDDLGYCLFLPRHAQLPAPAPSFVEAVQGAASAAPPPAALQHATELATRLIEDRRAVPLNLLGTYSEQPDFLVTPEVLPWVAAIRGERQWNAAPGGRSAPLVVRTWEVLDREGETTAVALRATLGRELTEAAVLRALIELWTTLRAVPIAAPGQETRWTLLKNRFPAQLTSGANTAQATGLSALLSIYLRTAVAATAEEAEIFLSPLTARSRIREVIHGMTAARQIGSMSVGPHTLLFVPGSLPEELPGEAEAAAPVVRERRPPRAEGAGAAGAARPPLLREFRPQTRETRGAQRPAAGGSARPWRSGEQPPGQTERGRPERRPEQRPERRESRFGPGPSSARPDRRERLFRPGASSARPGPPGARPGASSARGEGRPFDRAGRPPAQGPRDERPRLGGEKRSGQKPGFRKFGAKPFGRKESGGKTFGGPEGRGGRKPEGPRFGGPGASQQKPGFRKSGPKAFGGKKPGGKPFARPGGKPFARPAGKPFAKPGAKPVAGPGGQFPPRREGRAWSPGAGPARPGVRPRFGPAAGRPAGGPGSRPARGGGRPFNREKKFQPRANKNFRKPNPRGGNPRKNRKQDENPE